uniref:Glucanase n=1 Tax=uncultured virus TaxID=340016 RepID=D5L2C2_9VIRU|nr:glucanase [uncultured virus]
MTENSTALLFDILDTATQGDPDSAANNIALLNQLLTATDNDPSNISANEIALLTEILSIITDQPPDVAANEIAVLTEILAAIQSQNPQVRANKIALLNEIAANSQSLVDALNPVTLPVAPSDLVAWYPFRSGTGEDLTAGDSNFGDTTDYSATVNGATFQASGGVTDIQTGANSGAFDFDGTDDTIDLGTVADSDQSLTLMAWVKPDVIGVNQRVITKNDGRGGFPSGSIVVRINSSDAVDFTIENDAETQPIVTSTTTVSTSQFTHVAARIDLSSGDMSILINGQPEGSTATGQISPFSSQGWGLAEDVPSGEFSTFFDGTMDDARIYTAALSDSQINQIYLNTEP